MTDCARCGVTWLQGMSTSTRKTRCFEWTREGLRYSDPAFRLATRATSTSALTSDTPVAGRPTGSYHCPKVLSELSRGNGTLQLTTWTGSQIWDNWSGCRTAPSGRCATCTSCTTRAASMWMPHSMTPRRSAPCMPAGTRKRKSSRPGVSPVMPSSVCGRARSSLMRAAIRYRSRLANPSTTRGLRTSRIRASRRAMNFLVANALHRNTIRPNQCAHATGRPSRGCRRVHPNPIRRYRHTSLVATRRHLDRSHIPSARILTELPCPTVRRSTSARHTPANRQRAHRCTRGRDRTNPCMRRGSPTRALPLRYRIIGHRSRTRPTTTTVVDRVRPHHGSTARHLVLWNILGRHQDLCIPTRKLRRPCSAGRICAGPPTMGIRIRRRRITRWIGLRLARFRIMSLHDLLLGRARPRRITRRRTIRGNAQCRRRETIPVVRTAREVKGGTRSRGRCPRRCSVPSTRVASVSSIGTNVRRAIGSSRSVPTATVHGLPSTSGAIRMPRVAR